MSYWTCGECGGEFDLDISQRSHKRFAHPSPGLFRWRQRRWWAWISRHFYTLGISSGGCHSGTGSGWIVRNHYRGSRPYVLGIKRERWGHPWHRLRRGHWPNIVFSGMCGTCCPWPCCGATGYDHARDVKKPMPDVLSASQLADERAQHRAELAVAIAQRDAWAARYTDLAAAVLGGVYHDYDVKDDSGGSSFLCSCSHDGDGFPHEEWCGKLLLSRLGLEA